MSDERETEDRVFADRFRRAYRRTPLPDPEAQARIVAAVRGAIPPRRGGIRLAAWFEPRTLTLRPAVAMAAAIALIGMGALLARVGSWRAPAGALPGTTSASQPRYAVQFVVVAPAASRVALVGDFNGWDAAATPMRHGAGRNAWTVTVPLASGWHAYAFVVDGTRWIHDPGAPLAPPDEFGGPRSVVVVGEHGEGV